MVVCLKSRQESNIKNSKYLNENHLTIGTGRFRNMLGGKIRPAT